MILKADKLEEYISAGLQGKENGLGVVPPPNVEELKKSGAASLDLRLGRWFRTMRQSKETKLEFVSASESDVEEDEARITREHFERFDGQFILHPGQFVLGVTLEWIRMPSSLAAYVTGKSSRGRRGLIIETAPGVHPGFTGCLALEMTNVGEIPVALKPGMEICQLFLHQVSESDAATRSRFIGSRKPVLGPVQVDETVEKLGRPL